MLNTNIKYYPYGMIMPGRSYTSQSYRYGFNGMEKDDEIKGSGNSLDFGARIHDPRIGRFLSLDPRMAEFPFMSPYCYAANSPIMFVDEDGKGPGYGVLKTMASAGRSTIAVSTSATIGAGVIASASSGMAVDQYGNVALFNTRGGMGSSQSRDRGPSVNMGYTFQFSAEATVLPGVSNVMQLRGHGGSLAGGVGTPYASVNGGFVTGADGEMDGGMLGVGVGPSAGFAYQNTFTSGVFMTGSNFESISALADNSWSKGFAKTQGWNKKQNLGVWEVGKSELSYQAVSGQEGVFEAVVTTEYHFKSFGEAKPTSTSTTEGTGVYFTQDSDGNYVSTDLE